MTTHDPTPQNIEAETALLGSLLIDPDAILSVRDTISPQRFHRQAHRLIYSAMLTLERKHTPADLVTVIDTLDARGDLEEAGGAGYISSLASQTPTSINVAHYASIVLRTSVQRELLNASARIANLAVNESDPITALLQAETLLR